jgi:prepilin peptidase CpaA
MFFDSPASMLAGTVFTALLVAVAGTDLSARRIPNPLVLTLVIVGAYVATTVLRAPVGPVGAAAGFALGLGLWTPFWLMRVLGAGDVKLAAAIGVWLGPTGVIEASVLAALAGGVLAIAVLARRRRITALTSGVALWGAALLQGRLTQPLVNDKNDVLPYGVALAVGAVLTGWLPAAWLAL